MSLDDHIRHLTETILAELRSPIEASLRRLLEEVVATATRDGEAVAARALDEAATAHRAEVDALQAAAATERERALDELRTQATLERDAALQALRTALDEEHARQLQAREAQHDARAAGLVAEHEARLADVAARHEARLAELAAAQQAQLAELTSQHEAGVAEVRAEIEARHEARIAELRAEHEAGRAEALRAQDEAVAAVRESAAAEMAAAVQFAREAAAAGESAASVAWQAERAELQRAHEAEMDRVREQQQADAIAVQDERAEMVRWHDAELASLREQYDGERRALEAQLGQKHEAELAALQAQLHAAAVAAALPAAGAQPCEELKQEDEGGLARLQDQQDQQENAREAALREVLAAEREADLAASELLLDAFRQLDAGRSLTEVLGSLADHLAKVAGRSAVLLVNGDRLRGWRLSGMGDLRPADVDVPVGQAGVLGRAVMAGAPVASSQPDAVGQANDLPAFLSVPPDRVGLAVPISVGGRVVAIVYADDGGEEAAGVPGTWPETAEMLARHAGRCLEVLTLARVSGAAGRPPIPARGDVALDTSAPELQGRARPEPGGPEADEARQEESARRYARLLISEVKLYNESAVDEGRRARDLLARLGPEIDRARRLYEEKIPAAVRERADWFEQELVRTLAGGEAGLLGQAT